MAEEENRYLKMSAAERKRQRELMDYADAAEGAALDVVAASALKWAITHLKGTRPEDSKLPKAFEAINPQAMPKEALLAKPAGLSETEVERLKAAAIDAIKKAAKI